MTTLNQVELLLITISVTTLAVINIALIVGLMNLVNKAKGIASKADNIVTNLEEVSSSIKDAAKAGTSKHPFASIIKSIFNNSKED